MTARRRHAGGKSAEVLRVRVASTPCTSACSPDVGARNLARRLGEQTGAIVAAHLAEGLDGSEDGDVLGLLMDAYAVDDPWDDVNARLDQTD